jgi:hypothetical protein
MVLRIVGANEATCYYRKNILLKSNANTDLTSNGIFLFHRAVFHVIRSAQLIADKPFIHDGKENDFLSTYTG